MDGVVGARPGCLVASPTARVLLAVLERKSSCWFRNVRILSSTVLCGSYRTDAIQSRISLRDCGLTLRQTATERSAPAIVRFGKERCFPRNSIHIAANVSRSTSSSLCPPASNTPPTRSPGSGVSFFATTEVVPLGNGRTQSRLFELGTRVWQSTSRFSVWVIRILGHHQNGTVMSVQRLWMEGSRSCLSLFSPSPLVCRFRRVRAMTSPYAWRCNVGTWLPDIAEPNILLAFFQLRLAPRPFRAPR